MIVGNKFHITYHIYVNYLHKGCGCIVLKVSNCNYCSILYKVDRYKYYYTSESVNIFQVKLH